MRYPNRILPLGSLLAAFLILILPGIREIEYLIPTGSHARHRYRRLLKKKAIPPKTGNRVSSMFPESQPFILQQNPPLHVCGSEVRRRTTQTDLQSRHILLFRTFYKKLHTEQIIRQALLHTDGYFFYMLCRMLM